MKTNNIENYSDFVNPLVGEILNSLGMKKPFIKAEGHHLTYLNEAGEEGQVLDLVAGYGSLMFGHNHPRLLAKAKEFFEQKMPIHSQFSVKPHVGLLAHKLSTLAQKLVGETFLVRFANSGTEAVDLAIKHCEFKRVLKIQDLMKGLEHDLNQLTERYYQNPEQLSIPGEIFEETSMRGQIFEETISPAQLKSSLMRLNAEALMSRPLIIALKDAFHGKSIAAAQMTYSETFRKAFTYFGLQTLFLDLEEIPFVEEIVQDFQKTFYSFKVVNNEVQLVETEFPILTATILEPIQGEGGIIEIPGEAMQQLRSFCDVHQSYLIFDEIQSGMGRTGTFFASQPSQVVPDVYLIGKAIGGGITKNSAIFIKKDDYEENFGIVHTSTFAEDEFSAVIGLEVLEMLEENDGYAYKRIAEIGNRLIDGLTQIQTTYPSLIKEIRGKGGMIGVEFQKDIHSDMTVYRNTSVKNRLGYLLFSFLHESEGVRVLPTASAPNTLRLEPGIVLSNDEIDTVIQAFERLCRVLHCQDSYYFLRHITTDERGNYARPIQDFASNKIIEQYEVHQKKSNVTKVAFIAHVLDPANMSNVESSMAAFTSEERTELFNRRKKVESNAPTIPRRVRVNFGKEVDISYYVLTITAAQIVDAIRTGELDALREGIYETVLKAKEDGCSVVGLGGFTSIASNNCQSIQRIPDVPFTSGNALTTGLGYQALLAAVNKQELDHEQCRVLVVGGAGNIGQIYASLLTENFKSISLMGSTRKGSAQRLNGAYQRIYKDIFEYLKSTPPAQYQGMAKELAKLDEVHELLSQDDDGKTYKKLPKLIKEHFGKDPFIQLTTDPVALKQADVIVCTTNSPEPFIGLDDLKQGAVVCDLGIPLNVKEEVRGSNKVVFLQGGLAQLPNGEDISCGIMDVTPGNAYGCVTETLLMGVTERRDNYSYGNISRSQVKEILALASAYGFTVSNEHFAPIYEHD